MSDPTESSNVRFKLQLFGEFKLWRGQELVTHFYSDKVRALLVYLAVEGQDPLRRTLLIDVLWPRYIRNSALTNLRKGLHELRKIFDGAESLCSSRQAIWLERGTGEIWCDWWEVEALLDEVSNHEHGSLSSCPTCRAKLKQVQRISSGDICPSLSINEPDGFDRWRSETSWVIAQRIRALIAQLHLNLEPRSLGNVPRPKGDLLGRSDELDYLASLILAQPHRLISLVGMGGVGKTHLAYSLARRVAKEFPDGIWLTSLGRQALSGREGEGVGSPHLASLLGTTLGLHKVDQPSALLERLRDHRFLLIFDEFEGLLEDESEALRRVNEISEIMGAIPGCCLVLTSRVALRMEGELFYPLKGLPFPGAQRDLDDLMESPSTQLFMSVRNVRLDLPPPSEEEFALIGEIGRLLEGLPLGLCLAGALSQRLPLEGVLTQISEAPDSILSPFRDTPPRHRRLGELIDRSVDGLSPQARLMTIALSAWTGSIAIEDVASVLEGLIHPSQILEIMDDLVNCCLLEVGADKRYRQHSLIRQLLRSRADEWLGAMDVPIAGLFPLDERVRLHFIQRLIDARDGLTKGLLAARAPLRAACPDIMVSWGRTLDLGELERLVEAAPSLVELSFEVGRPAECVARLEALRAALETRGGEDAELAKGKVTFAIARGLGGLSMHKECRDALIAAEGPWLSDGQECLRHVYLGVEHLFLNHDELGRQQILEGLERATGRGIYYTLAKCLGKGALGMWRARLGQPGARSLLEESLHLAQEGQLQRSQIKTIINLAGLRIVEGDPEGCLSLLERGSTLVREQQLNELGVPVWMATGFALGYLGETERALNAYEEAAAEARRMGLTHSYVQSQVGCGHILESMGNLQGALERIQAIQPIAEVLGAPILSLRVEVFIVMLMAKLGDAHVEALFESLGPKVSTVAYRPMEITFVQAELLWKLTRKPHGAIKSLCDQLLLWIEEHPGLPGTDSIGCYLLCYQALNEVGDERAQRVLEEGIALLKERLVKVRHLWRRRQIVEGNPAALGLFELLKDRHGISKAQSLLGLSV